MVSLLLATLKKDSPPISCTKPFTRKDLTLKSPTPRQRAPLHPVSCNHPLDIVAVDIMYYGTSSIEPKGKQICPLFHLLG